MSADHLGVSVVDGVLLELVSPLPVPDCGHLVSLAAAVGSLQSTVLLWLLRVRPVVWEDELESARRLVPVELLVEDAEPVEPLLSWCPIDEHPDRDASTSAAARVVIPSGLFMPAPLHLDQGLQPHARATVILRVANERPGRLTWPMAFRSSLERRCADGFGSVDAHQDNERPSGSGG